MDKFWSLSKHKFIKELGFTPPKSEIHRFKYEHEKGCGDIFVSLLLTGECTLWEGEGRSVKGFRHDRKFSIGDTDWYLENERGTQAPKVLRGKIENYLKHYRETYDDFHVLFTVKDEDALEQIVFLFDEYKLPNFYWATLLNDFINDPLNTKIVSRNTTNTIKNLFQ